MPNNTDSAESNPALAVIEKPLMKMLARYRNQITDILPRHFDDARVLKLVVGALNKTPQLMNCTPLSVINSVISAAAMGLEIRPGSAYLVPYRNKKGHSECQLLIDYRGKIDLARRSGEVTDVDLDIVYSNDKFRLYRDGVGVKCIEHEPLTFKLGSKGERLPLEEGDRGVPLGALAVATFTKGGPPKILFMPKCDILEIKKRSKSADSGPWQTDELEMWKKTAAHRICKTLPQTPESQIADRVDDAEQGEVSFDIIDALPEDAHSDQPILPAGSQAQADKVAEERIKELKAKQAPAPAPPTTSAQPEASRQPLPTAESSAERAPKKQTIIDYQGDWPDNPQGEFIRWNGVLHKMNEETGNYQEVKEQAAAPAPQGTQAAPTVQGKRLQFGKKVQQ